MKCGIFCVLLFSFLPILIFSQRVSYDCPSQHVQNNRSYFFAFQYDFLQLFDDEIAGYVSIFPHEKFIVIGTQEDYYRIKFRDTLQESIFLVEIQTFNCNALVADAGYFSVSITTLPVKLRAFPKSFFDWEVNKSLGIGIGYFSHLRRKENVATGLLLNAGAASIVIDSFSTRGNMKRQLTADVLTVSLGICFMVTRNFQIGFLFGMDMISNRYSSYEWVYNKTPWFGFGIGYSFVNML